MVLASNILVPTDFSECSDHAASYAYRLAEKLGAKVHLLHVYAPPVSPESVDFTVLATGEIHNAAVEGLDQLGKRCPPTVTLGERIVMLGDPRGVIVQTAERLGVDLIVLGTHGRRGFKRLVLGSVAETVVRTAPCPVLAVRPVETEKTAT